MNGPSATNDPNKAGHVASVKRLYGEFGRYAIFAVHTRFEEVEWLVEDACAIDPITGLPVILRQEPSFEAALASLSL